MIRVMFHYVNTRDSVLASVESLVIVRNDMFIVQLGELNGLALDNYIRIFD